jgi:hypothetical protein
VPPKKLEKKASKKLEEENESGENYLQCKKLLNTQKSVFCFRAQTLQEFGKRRLR